MNFFSVEARRGKESKDWCTLESKSPQNIGAKKTFRREVGLIGVAKLSC